MAVIIQIRRDLAANWTSANPILAQGEFGYETDTGDMKVGDGSTVWTGLPYRLSSGEINTGSNQGVDGVGVFDIKSLVDLQFRNIAPASNKVTVVLNGKDIDLDVVDGQIDHDALLNFVTDEHIPHSGVSIIAGDGLSGGGNITTDRTLNIDINPETSATVAAGDELLIADVDDSNNIKKTTAQAIANLAPIVTDHGILTGLSDDDHTQYALLDGRTGGQTLIGSVDADGNLVLKASSNVVDGHIFLNSRIRTDFTAIISDEEAFEIDVDAAGFGDIKALEIEYITGAITSGQEEAVFLININRSSSVGGSIRGIEILGTSGAAELIALKAGVGADAIEQLQGSFANPDSALSNAANVLTEFTTSDPGGVNNIQLFTSDNDTVTLGSSSKFSEIEFILEIVASGAGIAPVFEYSTGVGTWTVFSPVDGTNRMRSSGVIDWELTDIPSWTIGAGSEFLIRITRTANGLGTPPTEDLVQIASSNVFKWSKDGLITIDSINASNDITSDGMSLPKMALLNM